MKITEVEREFEDYIRNSKHQIYRLAYSYVRNVDDALDIVQESIMKGFSSLHKLKNTQAVKTWFYRIVINTAIDFLRKRKREIAVEDELLLFKVDDLQSTKLDHYPDIDLEVSLANLPDMYRTIIILRFFEDMKISEIADMLDINTNTAKTRLYKGLSILKIQMEPDKEELI